MLAGNRFLFWEEGIIKQVLLKEPDANFFLLFSGTLAGYKAVVERFSNLPVRIEWNERFVTVNPPTPDELEARYQALSSQLSPAAIKRVLLSDRYMGEQFIANVRLERSSLSRQISDRNALLIYLVSLLEWLISRFDELQPVRVFSYCVAGAPAMALWELSRERGIPFATLDYSRIKGYHHLGNSPYNEFRKISEIYRSGKFNEQHREAARSLIREFRGELKQNEDWEMFARGLSGRLLYRSIIRELLLNIRYYRNYRSGLQYMPRPLARIFNIALSRVRGRQYEKLCEINTLEDLPKKFIYYPLHVDPEASTMVLAPYLQNQLTVIENLSRSVPVDFNIVIKEHVISLGWRTEFFYESIKQLPNVHMASIFLEGPKLVQKSHAVATITGTSGWEAILLGKPVILYGRPFYHALADGYLYINGWGDLSRNFESFLEQFKPVPDKVLEDFICSIITGSFPLSSEDYWQSNAPENSYLKNPAVTKIICNWLIGKNA